MTTSRSIARPSCGSLLLLLCSSLGWCLPLSSSLACLERNDERERRETIGQSMCPQKFVTTPLYRRVELGQKCALLCDENNLTDPGSAISIGCSPETETLRFAKRPSE